MEDVSNKTIVALLAIALVVTVVGTIVSVSKLGDMGGKYAVLSGAAVTDTGTTTLNLAGSVSIQMVDNAINFGNGYYNASCTGGYSDLNTTVTSISTGTPGTKSGTMTSYCWINTTAFGTYDAHHILNNGTTTFSLNISTTTTDAEAFLCGGSGSCPSSAARVKTQFYSTEGGLATCSSGVNNSLVDFLTYDGAGDFPVYQLCGVYNFGDDRDESVVDYKLIVPFDAPSGAKTLTTTYTATGI
ncbi:hypothetical protein HZC30_05620 [Candidatus Woesearchaeota archaeon]|nr:hypothetical protein [Candidatus Woesearchaeota archaeon]